MLRIQLLSKFLFQNGLTGSTFNNSGTPHLRSRFSTFSMLCRSGLKLATLKQISEIPNNWSNIYPTFPVSICPTMLDNTNTYWLGNNSFICFTQSLMNICPIIGDSIIPIIMVNFCPTFVVAEYMPNVG